MRHHLGWRSRPELERYSIRSAGGSGCPDWGFRGFCQSLKPFFWGYSIRPRQLPSKSFPIRHQSSMLSSDATYSYSRYWKHRYVTHGKVCPLVLLCIPVALQKWILIWWISIIPLSYDLYFYWMKLGLLPLLSIYLFIVCPFFVA
jgi:hypothetical protein